MILTRRTAVGLLAGAPALLSSRESTTLGGAAPASIASSHVKQIIVVCKTHFDIGYTHRVKDLLTYYRHQIHAHRLQLAVRICP